MVTSIVASARHLPGIAAGDAIGANVTMMTIVLGLAALARPFEINKRVRAYALIASAAGVMAALVLLGGHVGRGWGAVLVMAYAIAVAVVWWRERRPPAFGEVAEIEERERRDERAASRDTKAAVLVVGGVGLMAAGGWLAVSGAERIVSSLGLAESAVGLTFVALGPRRSCSPSCGRHSVGELKSWQLQGCSALPSTTLRPRWAWRRLCGP